MKVTSPRPRGRPRRYQVDAAEVHRLLFVEHLSLRAAAARLGVPFGAVYRSIGRETVKAAPS